MMDFLENEFLDFARCQRPDGSTYGTAGVCRKGKAISAAQVGELVRKAKDMGYNDKQIKEIADKVKAKYGVKQLKAGGDPLASVGRRLGEQEGIKPDTKRAKGRAKRAKKKAGAGESKPAPRNEAKAKKAKKEKPAPKAKTKKVAPKKEAKPAKEAKPSTYSKDQGKKIPKPEDAGLKKGYMKAPDGKGYDPEGKWDQKGNRKMGEGMFGAVKGTKGPPPGIIKKGDVGEFEAEAIAKMQGVDGFPTLHGQKITGDVKGANITIGGSVASAPGYIAMSKVDGIPMSLGQANGYFERKPEAAVAAMDEYVRLRKEMHMRGIAHNDMHSGNFFYDPKTAKGAVVDFGLAQISPRAALFEAMGTDGKPYGPDFQATSFRNYYSSMIKGKGIESTRLARFEANKLRAEQRLIELGYNPRGNIFPETRTNLRTGRGIRGKWENLTDEEATEVLGILYDGV